MTPLALPDSLRGALVVAVDDSACSREALRFAVDLAARLREPLHVVTAWNFVRGRAPERHQNEPPSEAAWQTESAVWLDGLLAEEVVDRDVRVTPVVVHGNTTPVLLAVSERASQLVVGSRGRGGFAGLLLGSTSDALVRHGSCPVTVVQSAKSRSGS